MVSLVGKPLAAPAHLEMAIAARMAAMKGTMGVFGIERVRVTVYAISIDH